MAEKLSSILLQSHRLTRAGLALSALLEASGAPVITSCDLFLLVKRVYETPQGLFLRKPVPDLDSYRALVQNLQKAKRLAIDQDYKRRAYRVLRCSDRSADEVCCLVDPFCYISHLSAMQRYGLTNRRPEALHLSRPKRQILIQKIKEKMDAVKGGAPVVPMRVVTHPRQVRKRRVEVYQTSYPGEWIQVRDSYARLSTIGQVFLEMLEEPSLCGGMAHVVDIWVSHAKAHLDDVVDAVNRSSTDIAKIRAGYLLEERLGFRDARINAWQKFAQRGSSRRLDPEKDYAPSFSETWMLSVNV
jgi:predicted transcriptional regulator of viral defense system